MKTEEYTYKGLPILYGELTKPFDTQGNRQIKVWCPRCKTHHYHGWPKNDPGLTHRTPNEPRIGYRDAHCITKETTGYQSYYIAPYEAKASLNLEESK